VLGTILPGREDSLLQLHGAAATVSSMDEAGRLAAAAARGGTRLTVHLKLDSGMHRLGAPREEAEAAARFLAACPSVDFAGAMTHLATAGTGAAYAERQLDRFDDFVMWLRRQALCPQMLHAANSAALALHPRSRYNMVRPGLAMYGIADPAEVGRCLELRPAMRLCARVACVRRLPPGEPVGYGCTWRTARDSTIATAGIGYADGLRTSMANRGHALLRGRRVPVVGRVSMDFTALDVTGMNDVRAGEEVVFLGRQGEAEITAVEAAASMGAIPYEVVCGIGPRVQRVIG
jgi:alanine racemase